MFRYLRVAIVVLVLGLAGTTTAQGQFHVTLEPQTARLVHRLGFRAGLPGGVPSPHELHFGLQGELEIAVIEQTARITVADLTLHGNETAFIGHEEWRAAIEQEARQTLLDAQFSVTVGPPRDRTELKATFSPFDTELVLEFFRQTLVGMRGGRDATPIDGPAYLFEYPVPEPTGLVLSLLSLVLFVRRHPRHKTTEPSMSPVA